MSHQLEIVLVVTAVVYAAACGVGRVMGRRGVLHFEQFAALRDRLTDPLTTRVHRLLLPFKMQCIVRKRWRRLFLLILINNLVLAAFVQRTLYGITVIVPFVLVVLQGLTRGVAGVGSGRGWRTVEFCEFGAYLLASAVGIHLGWCVLSWLCGIAVDPAAWTGVGPACVYGVIVTLLLVAALCETSYLKRSGLGDLKGVDWGELATRAMDMLARERVSRGVERSDDGARAS